MQFGNTIGTACLTFAITNIDDAFVLVTFFAEASTSGNLTPLKITLGQYIGFTVIMVVSLIGYAVAVVLPSEPIGFLGLLPLLLGVWKFFGLLFPKRGDTEQQQSASTRIANSKPILKVALITMMNGGDNIGTYVPLFSQAEGAEIAIYVVVYYILLGVWCFAAFLIMKQRHILRIAEKYAAFVIPFLYMGLGIYIVVNSDCYPWSIHKIDDHFLGDPGKTVMGVVTAFLLSSIMGTMVWVKMRKQHTTLVSDGETALAENTPAAAKGADNDGRLGASPDSRHATRTSTERLGNDLERAETRSIEAAPNREQVRLEPKIQPQAGAGNGEIQAPG